MEAPALGLSGSLEVVVRRRDGAVMRRTVRNRVLAEGRRFIAGSLIGQPSQLRFAIAIGTGADANDDAMTDLVRPLLRLKVADPALKDDAVVLQASHDPPAPITIAESGLVLTYRSVGSGNAHLSTLYNRAVLDPAAVVGQGETLTLTWTLSFHPITA